MKTRTLNCVLIAALAIILLGFSVVLTACFTSPSKPTAQNSSFDYSKLSEEDFWELEEPEKNSEEWYLYCAGFDMSIKDYDGAMQWYGWGIDAFPNSRRLKAGLEKAQTEKRKSSTVEKREAPAPVVATKTNQSSSGSTRSAVSLYTGNGGKGIVIAVPAPIMTGGNDSNDWMPLLFQDLITSDIAKYSAMTVLDRLNVSMALAEQQLSTTGDYSDDDYASMGKLTNAQYIVAGSIRNVSGRYATSFRINHIETNEIKAVFNKIYHIEDIESGLAAKEAVRELLAGMGVELTAEGERQLLTIQERTVKAQVRLAQGIAAEKNNNVVQSLVYFHESLNADSGMREASQRIQTFAHGSPGASIRERANWATEQKAKWEKIFNDLTDYVQKNVYIVVYDFSTITDRFDARTNRVTITLTPGVKLIPDSSVLTVWKTVNDEWQKISAMEENKSWANSLSVKQTNVVVVRSLIRFYNNWTTVALYDKDGIRIIERQTNFPDTRINPSTSNGLSIAYNNNLQVLPQKRYFDNIPYASVSFTVPLKDITDELSAKPLNTGHYTHGNFPSRIMTVVEWEQWLRSQ